jgi:hypothetical protein
MKTVTSLMLSTKAKPNTLKLLEQREIITIESTANWLDGSSLVHMNFKTKSLFLPPFTWIIFHCVQRRNKKFI